MATEEANNAVDELNSESVSAIKARALFRPGDKPNQLDTMTSEMKDDDDDDDDADSNDGDSPIVIEGLYNPKDYENLNVSSEMKELFQRITAYTVQNIELDHQLKPFIPDFIPAVGDIDAFIKVPRPDGAPNKLGLTVLDEPSAYQSEPTVLNMQLRAQSKEMTAKLVAVKSVSGDNLEIAKEIDSWIASIDSLHASKPLPTVHYTEEMPDIDTLMQEWPPEVEELLKTVSLPGHDTNCSLEEYVNIVTALLDIPQYKNKIHSLYVFFTLFLEFRNHQHFKALAMENKMDNSLRSDRLVL